jgi:eukaryotic-like serine/threonine-protein kinase
MTGRIAADDPQLLAVASSIANGVAVDWSKATVDPDNETTAVLDELRALEGMSRRSQAVPDRWGPFAIRGEIGHGSYGTVYRAHDGNLDVDVALKVIRPRAGSPAGADRALNEARLLAQVNHPNVIRVFQAERVGEEVGIAMELVRGRTLDDLVSHEGPFSAREATLIGVDICCALAAVHGAKLVHGDVKAQNAMRATGGRTVLMDFGAGYDGKTDEAAGRRLAGTPLYLAPEIFEGAARTPVSDVYSVGVLLFYLATGAFPVEGHTGSEVRRRHALAAPRRRLRDVRPDLPDAFIHVVERATAERPQQRHQTAGELEAELKQALLPEAAKPVPLAPVAWPRLVLAAAGVVVALGAWLAYDGGITGDAPVSVATMSSAAPSGGPGAVPAAPIADAADAYRIEAAFYRERNRTRVRLEPGARVAPGDSLSLQVTSSVPTYVYVVNEDDLGASFLLFPLPGFETANPLPAGTPHEIPGKVNGTRVFWTVSSAGGREHFLIFASPHPLSPAFQRVFDALPRPSADAPTLAQPLSNDLVSVLRGVGGLTTAPAPVAGPGLRAEFGSPLPGGEETARGVWVRQLTLENPAR